MRYNQEFINLYVCGESFTPHTTLLNSKGWYFSAWLLVPGLHQWFMWFGLNWRHLEYGIRNDSSVESKCLAQFQRLFSCLACFACFYLINQRNYLLLWLCCHWPLLLFLIKLLFSFKIYWVPVIQWVIMCFDTANIANSPVSLLPTCSWNPSSVSFWLFPLAVELLGMCDNSMTVFKVIIIICRINCQSKKIVWHFAEYTNFVYSRFKAISSRKLAWCKGWKSGLLVCPKSTFVLFYCSLLWFLFYFISVLNVCL